MASSSLISTVNGYENYIQVHGVDEQVMDAMEEAARVAILTEKDVEYGLKVSARAKELTEQFYFSIYRWHTMGFREIFIPKQGIL